MIVLDASVITKWFVEEEDGSEAAARYEDAHTTGEELVVVPSLTFYEVTNALRYKKGGDTLAVETALDILGGLDLTVFAFAPVELKDVSRFAYRHDVSVYDAAYAVLAERLGCPLVTADKKLHKKLQTLPWVSLL